MQPAAKKMIDIQPLRATFLALILVSYVATFSGAAIVSMRIDYAALLPLLFVLISCMFLLAYSKWRDMPRLRPLIETLFGCLAMVIPTLLSTYLAMKANMPLADDTLVGMDGKLPMDWNAFIRFIDAHPLLASALGFSYESFSTQLLLLPLLFCLLRQDARAYQFVIAFALIGFTSAAIAIWYPALGTYSVYAIDSHSLKNIDTHFGYFFLTEFHAVRNDPEFVFTLGRAAGIVTFPSVHAAVACLCAWATWRTRWLRYPSLVLNLLMAISAVSHANHYFVDVLAAVPLAAFCVCLAVFAPAWLAAVARALQTQLTPVRAD